MTHPRPAEAILALRHGASLQHTGFLLPPADAQALLRYVESLEADRERLQGDLTREVKARSEKPDFWTFIDLKNGIVGTILSAVQNGEISRNKAIEALAQVAHGIEPTLPGNLPDAIPEDITPLELMEDRRRLDSGRIVLRGSGFFEEVDLRAAIDEAMRRRAANPPAPRTLEQAEAEYVEAVRFHGDGPSAECNARLEELRALRAAAPKAGGAA